MLTAVPEIETPATMPPYWTPTRTVRHSCGGPIGMAMPRKHDVWQGTLAMMVLRTLDVLGPQHGYGLARRIEQVSDDRLAVNHGTLYPVLARLEQEGAIASDWGVSDNNRRARFYRITKAGRKQLEAGRRHWEHATSVMARFFALKGETS